MRRRLAPLSAVAAGLLAAPAAVADHWPVAGGSPSRSANAASAPGSTPVTGAWMASDGQVRTPVVISGGGGAAVQRVAYGTSDGRLHLRLLATGAPVGPPEGVNLDEGYVEDDGRVFGELGAVGFADTSTEDRLGQLVVVHNDDNFGAQKVYVARVRLDSGEIVAQDIIPSGTAPCSTDSSPLLTPPAASGARLLYFTMICNQGLNRYLVRVPMEGDATSPASRLGRPGFALIPGATDVASPSLVVLRNKSGAPVFHVVVPRTGGLSIFDANDALEATTGTTERQPTMTAALEGADEVPRTPIAPSTVSGEVPAGGSGSPAAPAIYVAADAAGVTKVYRLVQNANEPVLKAERVVSLGEGSGAPGPSAALSETVTATGLSPGGTLLVTHATNATLLRTSDLAVVHRLSSTPLPAGAGFARTAPAISGALAFLTRDGSAEQVPEQLVLRLDGLSPLAAADFARGDDRVPGRAGGQPAVSRGHAVLGTATGAYAYRTRDAAGPTVALVAPAHDAEVTGTIRLAARAADPAGVESVTFRLLADGGAARTLGRATQPDAGGSFGDGTFTLPFPTPSVPNGSYLVEAIATDSGGNTGASERRRIRIANSGGAVGLPPGACANALTGSAAADRITGSSGGDRILGGDGDDRLDGAAGHDCVLGEAGDDVLTGGSGDDLLEGAAGEDVLAGGAGRNRLDGGAGADVARGGGGRERFFGGAGNDTLLGGRGKDRMSGGSGRDSLKGESGNDRISGGSGNDSIAAGSGSNRIDGGSGNDRIVAVNGRRDRITCGKGRDRVTADRRDRVSRSCERVSRRGRR